MAPPTNFPAAGPDLTLSLMLFAGGFVLAVLGYLVGSTTVRALGILIVFVGVALFFGEVVRNWQD